MARGLSEILQSKSEFTLSSSSSKKASRSSGRGCFDRTMARTPWVACNSCSNLAHLVWSTEYRYSSALRVPDTVAADPEPVPWSGTAPVDEGARARLACRQSKARETSKNNGISVKIALSPQPHKGARGLDERNKDPQQNAQKQILLKAPRPTVITS